MASAVESDVCADARFWTIPAVGETGIIISGSPGCTYSVRLSESETGLITVHDVTVDASGFGSLDDQVLTADTMMEVGPRSLTTVTDSFVSVPTLGEWGLAAMCSLMLAAGLTVLRRQKNLPQT